MVIEEYHGFRNFSYHYITGPKHDFTFGLLATGMTDLKPIKIVLADDHELFRDGFRSMLKKQTYIRLEGEASNGEELVSLCFKLKPDIVITDIKMPRMDGIEATRLISSKLPSAGIIALSMFNEDHLIMDMLAAGAKGYLLKNAHKNEIQEAIKTVYQGQPYYCSSTSLRLAQMIARSSLLPSKISKLNFSEREIRVIQLICEQYSNKEIAGQLNLSVRTIEGYRDKILESIGAKNMAGIVIYAIRNNIYKTV